MPQSIPEGKHYKMMEYNYLKKVGMTSNNNVNNICQSCGKPINKPDEYGKNSMEVRTTSIAVIALKMGILPTRI